MTKSAQEAVPESSERPLRFVSTLETVDELIELFTYTVDEKTIFIATKLPVPVGQQRRFLITLKNGQPVMCGHGEVLESPARLAGPGSPTGIRVRMLRLTKDSATIHARVLDLRRERAEAGPRAEARPLPPPPSPRPRRAPTPDPAEDEEETDVSKGVDPLPARPPEERVPSSPFVLPANPLSELSDKSLHAMIECAMYEDTGMPPRFEPEDMVGLAPRTGDTMVRGFSGRTVDLEALAALVGARPPMPAMPAMPAVPVAPVEPPPPAAPAPEPAPPPPPVIIEVPGAPVKVSVGFASQALTAILGIALGAIAVYAVLELDLFGPRKGESADSPPAAEPVAAPAVDAAAAPPEPVAADAAVAVAATADAAVATPPGPVPSPGDETCTATIEAPTERAEVLVDGRRVGQAPIRGLPVPCGESIEIAIEHPRYGPFSQRGVASPGAPLRIRAALQRPSARLKLTSSPAGAILTVDGKVVGRAPIELEVTAYTNISVTGTLDGYKPWKKRVRVPAAGSTVHVRLESGTAP